MKKIFFLLIAFLFVVSTSAQKPSAILQKASVAPVIGGGIDSIWADVDPVIIERKMINETPTVGEVGETYWKGLWTEVGIYILVYVTDDDYYPFYQRSIDVESDKSSYDQVEIYFDCNFVLEDGKGGAEGGNSGHYKISPVAGGPAFAEGYDDGTKHDDYLHELGYQYSINATNAPHYFVEYFIPFSGLLTSEGVIVDIEGDIGFDVVVIDNDNPGGNEDRNRMIWANNLVDGIDNDINMDNAGIINLDGCYPIYPNYIILTGGDISEDNEQFVIGIESCFECQRDEFIWVINEEETTAIVKVSDDGIVTPISDGVLKIKALSSDGYIESNEIMINIWGQIITIQDMSWLVDGLNEFPNEDVSPNNAWKRDDGLNNHTAFIENRIFHFSSDSVLSSASAMKIRQVVDLPVKYADEEFLIVFKMWAATETSFQLVLEDRNNEWDPWGIATETYTSNAISIDGKTRWDLTVTDQPEWFNMHFIPVNIKENSILDFSFQTGLTGVEIQMDSLYLITPLDSAIIAWNYCCMPNVVTETHMKTLNVYPNPATNILNIILEKDNTNVTIYSSLGIKMEEIFINEPQHVIDVSNYPTGFYFVVANGKVAKFIK